MDDPAGADLVRPVRNPHAEPVQVGRQRLYDPVRLSVKWAKMGSEVLRPNQHVQYTLPFCLFQRDAIENA